MATTDIFKICWQPLCFEKLKIKHWEDDEYLIFNPLSGDTHLLNESSMFILKTLHQQPMTLEQFINSLADDKEIMDEMKKHLPSTIQILAQIGLIEPSLTA